MRKPVFIILFAAAVSFSSCSEDLVGPAPSGAYSYKSYDTTGTAIVEGWFTMSQQDSTSIIGEWHFEKIGNPQDIGPQVGDGELMGGIKNGIIWVELNPQMRDDNLQLTGSMVDNKYSGEWIYITIAGVTNHGTFEAIKN